MENKVQRCTLVACEGMYTAPLAIRKVATAVIGTLFTLSVCMTNHTVHHTMMCSVFLSLLHIRF